MTRILHRIRHHEKLASQGKNPIDDLIQSKLGQPVNEDDDDDDEYKALDDDNNNHKVDGKSSEKNKKKTKNSNIGTVPMHGTSISDANVKDLNDLFAKNLDSTVIDALSDEESMDDHESTTDRTGNMMDVEDEDGNDEDDDNELDNEWVKEINYDEMMQQLSQQDHTQASETNHSEQKQQCQEVGTKEVFHLGRQSLLFSATAASISSFDAKQKKNAKNLRKKIPAGPARQLPMHLQE